jgi:sporulation protein YlmC with PRC-barrel domain
VSVPQLSDFRLGAVVAAEDGSKAGTLTSVLVEADGFDPRALVIKDESTLAGRLVSDEKFFITDEVVVPIAAVESASHDLIRLSMSVDDIRKQPPYLSYRFGALSAGEAGLEEVDFLGGGLGLPANAQEMANKPADQIEIDHDENVMLGTTGHRLGRVQDVLFDNGELVGIVIKPEGFFKQDVVLPIRFISRADDMALFADLKESDIEQLEPFVDPE